MNLLQEEYPELMWDGKEELPIIVSFGAGVDSTAILVGLYERGIKPDYIIFSDTGAERPDIYAHIERVNKWCDKVGFPPVSVTFQTKKGKPFRLLEHCETYGDMPSLAYGFKSCSVEYKIRPVEKFIKSKGIEKHIQCIGYGTGEIDRALKALGSAQKIRDSKKRQSTKDKMRVLWFPLIDWKLNREQCKELSQEVGFCTSKSSCFFCPAYHATDVLKLKKLYPELFEKALEIESRAMEKAKKRHKEIVDKAVEKFGDSWAMISEDIYKSEGMKYPKDFSTKGLGRSWSWKSLSESESPELPFMEMFGVDAGCGCTDF